MKQVVFDETSATQDWTWRYRLLQPDHAHWDEDEEIVLGMTPDRVLWDDYGVRQRSYPYTSSNDVAPFFQASSKSQSGNVVLTDPNIIDIWVPWNMMRQMGPGSVHVSLSWRRTMPPPGEAFPSPIEPARKAEHLRIWAKRLGVRPETLLAVGGAPLGATSRTSLVVGTLPVIDGVA